MNNIGIIFGMVCLLVAVWIVFRDKKEIKRIIQHMDDMLTDTIDGNFKETTFDESLLSALEAKCAYYLSASMVSAQNITMEKDKIKELISDISHQTKTPIANLLLYIELLQEETLSVDAQQYVDILHMQTEKLKFFIDALVKLSRLENGILSLAPKTEPIQPMLQDVVSQFASKAKCKNISLEAEDTVSFAQFDMKWTTEALCNIVDNAVKYTEKGTIDISVKPYEMFVRIDITDTGMGISEEEQAKIFTRFYRSEQVTDQEGVGIGLYLAREIISEEGGYIKVSSQYGQGSTFSVYLPVSEIFLQNC